MLRISFTAFVLLLLIGCHERDKFEDYVERIENGTTVFYEIEGKVFSTENDRQVIKIAEGYNIAIPRKYINSIRQPKDTRNYIQEHFFKTPPKYWLDIVDLGYFRIALHCEEGACQPYNLACGSPKSCIKGFGNVISHPNNAVTINLQAEDPRLYHSRNNPHVRMYRDPLGIFSLEDYAKINTRSKKYPLYSRILRPDDYVADEEDIERDKKYHARLDRKGDGIYLPLEGDEFSKIECNSYGGTCYYYFKLPIKTDVAKILHDSFRGRRFEYFEQYNYLIAEAKFDSSFKQLDYDNKLVNQKIKAIKSTLCNYIDCDFNQVTEKWIEPPYESDCAPLKEMSCQM